MLFFVSSLANVPGHLLGHANVLIRAEGMCSLRHHILGTLGPANSSYTNALTHIDTYCRSLKGTLPRPTHSLVAYIYPKSDN